MLKHLGRLTGLWNTEEVPADQLQGKQKRDRALDPAANRQRYEIEGETASGKKGLDDPGPLLREHLQFVAEGNSFIDFGLEEKARFTQLQASGVSVVGTEVTVAADDLSGHLVAEDFQGSSGIGFVEPAKKKARDIILRQEDGEWQLFQKGKEDRGPIEALKPEGIVFAAPEGKFGALRRLLEKGMSRLAQSRLADMWRTHDPERAEADVEEATDSVLAEQVAQRYPTRFRPLESEEIAARAQKADAAVNAQLKSDTTVKAAFQASHNLNESGAAAPKAESKEAAPAVDQKALAEVTQRVAETEKALDKAREQRLPLPEMTKALHDMKVARAQKVAVEAGYALDGKTGRAEKKGSFHAEVEEALKGRAEALKHARDVIQTSERQAALHAKIGELRQQLEAEKDRVARGRDAIDELALQDLEGNPLEGTEYWRTKAELASADFQVYQARQAAVEADIALKQAELQAIADDYMEKGYTDEKGAVYPAVTQAMQVQAKAASQYTEAKAEQKALRETFASLEAVAEAHPSIPEASDVTEPIDIAALQADMHDEEFALDEDMTGASHVLVDATVKSTSAVTDKVEEPAHPVSATFEEKAKAFSARERHKRRTTPGLLGWAKKTFFSKAKPAEETPVSPAPEPSAPASVSPADEAQEIIYAARRSKGAGLAPESAPQSPATTPTAEDGAVMEEEVVEV